MIILLAIGSSIKVGAIIVLIALLGYNVIFGGSGGSRGYSSRMRSYDIEEYRQDGSKKSYTKSYQYPPTIDELNRGRFGGNRVLTLTCTETYVSSAMKSKIRNEGK